MKAAVLYHLNRPLQIETQIEVPPLQAGQILVKMAYSGVCHSQLMEVRGGRGNDPYLPHLLGHEGSGIVLEVGAEVTKVQPGDRVILGWIKGSGRDTRSCIYQCGDQKINSGAITTFSETTVVSENRCVKIPDGIPMDVAALFGCAIPTGAGIITNTLKPKAGSSIAIFGMGGIGLSALMATQLYECSLVITVDIEASKLELSRHFGATHTIQSSKDDPVATIRQLTGGLGVDYSVEAAGLSQTIEQAFLSVKKGGGLCVFASHPRTGEKISLDPHDLISGRQIQGTWGGNCDPDRDIPEFARLYRAGKLPLEKMIPKRYRLEEINQALEDLENRKVVRPLIEIDSSIR